LISAGWADYVKPLALFHTWHNPAFVILVVMHWLANDVCPTVTRRPGDSSQEIFANSSDWHLGVLAVSVPVVAEAVIGSSALALAPFGAAVPAGLAADTFPWLFRLGDFVSLAVESFLRNDWKLYQMSMSS